MGPRGCARTAWEHGNANNGDGRSKAKGGSCTGTLRLQREVGDEREAHQEHDGGGSGLDAGLWWPEFVADPAGAEDEDDEVELDVVD